MCAGLQAMNLKLFGELEHKMPNVTGVYIPETVEGDYDELPEQAFYMVGSIEEAVEKAKTI